MKLSFFLTDRVYLSVLFGGLAAMLYSLRRVQTRVSFCKVLLNPLALIASMMLLFFVLVSILDSIHLNTALVEGGDSKPSLLDASLAPLGQSYEKSYSSPMALSLFSSEVRYQKGAVLQVYPRLTYPPAYLKNKSDRRVFLWQSLQNAVQGFVLGVLFVFLVAQFKRYLYKTSSIGLKERRSWIVAALTLGSCIALIIFLYSSSRGLHVLGTGKIGEDILYYAIKSIRTGLVIGLVTTLVMMPLALIFGVAAGYFGGFIDDVIQYVYTTLSSVPGVLLITAAVLSLETYIANHPDTFKTLAEMADVRLLALCLILGVTSWTSLCRLVRAEVLKLRETDYVLAGRALGSSAWRILSKHLIPNVMHIVVITVILDFSFLVLAEAVLSYVGVGVSPLTMSWGNMINAARLELARDPLVWWPVVTAFSFMFSLVLASNIFADAIRDAFDPHQ